MARHQEVDPDAIPVLKRSQFKGLLVIDRSDLEGHLETQARDFHDIAEQVVRVTAERDAAKLFLDELAAELDKEIRATAAKAEEKTTEAGILNKIKDHKRMKTAQADFLAVKEELELWQALRESFHQRHGMLKSLLEIELRKMDIEIFQSRAERDAATLRHKRGEVNDERAGSIREAKRKKGK